MNYQSSIKCKPGIEDSTDHFETVSVFFVAYLTGGGDLEVEAGEGS